MPWAQSIATSIGRVEKEVIEIRSEDREAALACIGAEGGVDNSSNQLLLIDKETKRAGAAENTDTDEKA